MSNSFSEMCVESVDKFDRPRQGGCFVEQLREKWQVKDLNLRSITRRIYSLLPLAARATCRVRLPTIWVQCTTRCLFLRHDRHVSPHGQVTYLRYIERELLIH